MSDIAANSSGETVSAKRDLFGVLWPQALFILAYILCGGFSEGLVLIPGVAIRFWPPAGLFVAALLLASRSSWWRWVIAGCAAELICNAFWFGNPVPLALVYYAGNSLEALAAAWIVGKIAIKPFRLESLRDAAAFVLAGLLAPILGATVIALTDHLLGKHPFSLAWSLVWLGDATGLLVSTPLTFVAVQVWQERLGLNPWRVVEATAAIVLLVVVGVCVLLGWFPTVYVVLPIMLWLAAQFQLRGAAIALGVTTLMVAMFARMDIVEFAGDAGGRYTHAVMLQTFLGVAAVSTLLTAVISLQHRQLAAQLRATNAHLEQRVAQRTTELARKEERFRLASDAVNGIIYEYDHQSGHVERSRGLLEVLGYRLDEVPPTAAWWAEQIHPDDRERLDRTDTATITGATVLSEYRIRHKDGRWLHVEDRAVLLRDGDGRLVRMVGCTEDVTHRKELQERTVESERLLRRTLDTAATGLTRCGRDLRYLSANPAYARIAGLSQRQIVGRSIVEVIGKEAFDIVRPYIEKVLRGVPVEFEAEVPFAVGGKRYLHVVYTPDEDGPGNVVGWVASITDITARKQADEQLREGERRLRLVMEAAGIGIWDWDLATDAVAWTPECYVIHGMREGEFGGTAAAFDRLVHPEDRERVWATVRSANDTRTRYECEFRIVRPDGEVRWVANYGRVVVDDAGQSVRMLGTIADITERKQAEDRLIKSEAFARQVSDVAPSVLYVYDLDVKRNVWANRGTFDGLGYSRESLDALDGNLLEALLHPEDQSEYQAHAARLAELADGQVADFEYRMKAADGSYRWLVSRDMVFRRADDGRVTQIIGAALDITDSKRSEEERAANQQTLFNLIELCPFGIYIVDADFRIASVNSRSQDKAFANVRPLIGRPFDEAMRILWPEPVADECIRVFRHTLATGEPFSSRDFVNPRADTGQTEGYEWELHRILLPEGRYGVVCYYFDATKLRQVEQQLKEADQKKDEFLATLSHELRNPLAPIRNGLEIMRLADNDSQAVEDCRSIMERQVDQMTHLIDDLMDLSRISQGKIVLQKTRLNLADVVRNAVDTSRPLIEDCGHELGVELPAQPVYVDGDNTRLTQVFANLLNNAAKYTERGGRIRLAFEKRDADVLVSVEDNGVGIAQEMLHRVFDMFAQVDRSLEQSRGGLGIGLNIVKRLVEMHDGSITVQSDGPGMGSRFTVRLPVVQPVTEVRPSHSPSSNVPPSRRRILVVDDNRDGAESTASLLEILGNETRIAHDGLQAVALAETFAPDLILMDIGMPRLNGYDACRRIREQRWGKEIIIVAQTGWGQDEDRRQALDAGFNSHLTKPIAPVALQKLLSELPKTTA